MSNALVIAHQGNSTMYIRSDYVAARMMQQHIDPKSGSEMKIVDARKCTGKKVAADAAHNADRPAEVSKPRKSPIQGEQGTGIGKDRRNEALQHLREKVAEMSRALNGLVRAAESIGTHKFLITEGDSATAVAYAGRVLGEIQQQSERRASEGTKVSEDAADAEFVEVRADETAVPDADDAAPGIGVALTVTENHVDHEEGANYSDDISMRASGRARNIHTGDDSVTVSSDEGTNLRGGNGDDTINANANRATMKNREDGDNAMNVTASWVRQISDDAADDTGPVTDRNANRMDVGSGNDVFNLQVGQANLALRAGMGNDVVNLKDRAHLEVSLKDPDELLGKAVNAVWEGDDLAVSFDNGDNLRINNAANAGSLSLRAGDRVIALTPPSIEPAVRLLDVNV